MKAISSAIVVTAGLIGMSASDGVIRGLPQMLTFAGCLIAAALGLVGWWAALKNER